MKLSLIALLCVSLIGCNETSDAPKSSSGVSKANVQVPVGPDGFTTEQRNIRDRLIKDNEPGSIKHLYVISAYSGQVLIYSTVRGKVTSGGKRLTPTTVVGGYAQGWYGGIPITISGIDMRTTEVLQDDGAYGSSDPYLFWFDVKGIYHQHFVQGGQIVHISSEPLSIKSVVINMELSGKNETPEVEDALPHPTPPSKAKK